MMVMFEVPGCNRQSKRAGSLQYSPLWRAVAAKKGASWRGLSRQDWTWARSDATTGRSENVCLGGSWSGDVPNQADQSNKYACKNWHSGLPEPSVRINAWRDKVLAADARKAGSASDATRLSPRPPSLTGKEAWSHWLSEASRNCWRLICLAETAAH